MRPGTGRKAGLGHAGGRAPTVGALGDAGAVAEGIDWPGDWNWLGKGQKRGNVQVSSVYSGKISAYLSVKWWQ